VLLLGTQWGKNVFFTSCSILADYFAENGERVKLLPRLRSRIVSLVYALTKRLDEEHLVKLEGYLLSLSEYPPPEVDVPQNFREQTKTVLDTLWNHIQNSLNIKQQQPVDILLPEVMKNLENIFSSEYYVPTNSEIIFAESDNNLEGVRERHCAIDFNGKWNFQLTDLTNTRVKRKRFLEQFEDIDAILFFVDLQDDYSKNSVLTQNFEEFVNSDVFVKKPVILVGYNKHLAEKWGQKGDGPENLDFVSVALEPFLEKRRSHVNCQHVNLNNLEEVKEMLNLIISVKPHPL